MFSERSASVQQGNILKWKEVLEIWKIFMIEKKVNEVKRRNIGGRGIKRGGEKKHGGKGGGKGRGGKGDEVYPPPPFPPCF